MWNKEVLCILILTLSLSLVNSNNFNVAEKKSSVEEVPNESTVLVVCPNGDRWCSSLDESEKLALEAIHSLHHQLDDDKNGNIDLFESNEFLREELKYDKDYEKRQENFHRNNDNQVSVRELWETWVRSEVHNWTVDQTAEWIGTFVGLPHYQDKFSQLEINGTYLPRLAVNHQNFLSTNLGIKDVITRQKLTLKAQDVVLFGPPRDHTNHTKDVILTTMLVVALTVCYLVYCRYKSSQRDLSRMSKDMEALMKAEETLRDLQKELEQAKCDQEVREKEAVIDRSSSNDGDELIRLRDEVTVLRNELQRAEVELQDKCWVPPPALTHWLQLTYELETKSHNKKRQSAEKQLKQAKEACDKLKKKRSSLMGAFVATHARSIDDVDKAILEARSALTEVTQELQERMNRWKQIEMLVKAPIVNNPGIPSLEILLRTGSRLHAHIGTGSVMSNSQDDIDDDGASSIYCPSAVHKLISTSAYMMFPGQSVRSYQQQSTSDFSSHTNYGGAGCYGDPCRPSQSQSPDISRREKRASTTLSQNQSFPTECSHHLVTDFTDCNEVSGPITNIHAPIARSKSVQSMLSLREHRSFNRESSSKDSSNGEDDIMMGNDAAEMSARDRRVTFRAAADRRSGQLRSYQGRTTSPLYEPKEFEEMRNFYARKPYMSASRLEGPKSSEEETQSQRKKQLKEEPDLISCLDHHHSNSTSAKNNIIMEANNSIGSENDAQSDASHYNTQQHNYQNSSLEVQTTLPEKERANSVLLINSNTKEEVQRASVDVEESTSSKSSFFKKVSKLMKLPTHHHTHSGNDGNVLNGRKTSFRSSFSRKEKHCENGNTQGKLDNTINTTVTSDGSSSSNIISEKVLLPDGANFSKTCDDDSNELLSKSSKPHHRRSFKLFSTLRRNKQVEASN